MCSETHCSKCPFSKYSDFKECCCDDVESHKPTKAVDLVEEWGKNHPTKTYMKDFLEKFPTYIEDFLEKFPNASKRASKISTVCRQEVYSRVCSFGVDCYKCWNEAMGESKD